MLWLTTRSAAWSLAVIHSVSGQEIYLSSGGCPVIEKVVLGPWAIFAVFFYFADREPFGRCLLCWKKKKNKARCSWTERGVGMEREHADVCACLCTRSGVLHLRQAHLHWEDQSNKKDSRTCWALKHPSSVQQSLIGRSRWDCCLFCFPAAVDRQGRWRGSGKTITVMNAQGWR